MTLSNALPFQFWLDGEETFNEKEVCGITPICWCQPWICTDEINLQFQDDEDIDYSLNILNTNDEVLENLPFTQDQIYTEDYLSSYPLSGFTNEAGGDTDWTPGANPTVTITGSPIASSDNFVETVTGIPAGDYILKAAYDFSSFGPTIIFTFYKDGVSVGSTSSSSDPDGGVRNLSLTLTDAPDTMKIKTSWINLIGSRTITLYSLEMNKNGYYYSLNFTPSDYCNRQVRFQIQNDTASPASIDAFSDCVLLKESHSCTVGINYYNNTNFAGIIYSNTSPQVAFKLLIPAIFFEEDTPTEQEDIELSNSEIVRLYNKLELKKRMDIGFMPAYMHQKLQLVLMHDNVTIDGKNWLRRDAYEKKDGHRMYPLRRASVWLHDKDFIKENQL
jgi:hypothetical protein